MKPATKKFHNVFLGELLLWVIAQQIKVATQSYCTTVVTAALPRKLETSWKIRTISNSFKVAPSAALVLNFLFNFLENENYV